MVALSELEHEAAATSELETVIWDDDASRVRRIGDTIPAGGAIRAGGAICVGSIHFGSQGVGRLGTREILGVGGASGMPMPGERS